MPRPNSFKRFIYVCIVNLIIFFRTIQTEKEKQTEEGRKAASDMFSDDFTPTLSNKQMIRGSDSQDPNLQASLSILVYFVNQARCVKACYFSLSFRI